MKTVADLWPGDVVIVRAPGQYFDYSSRVTVIEGKRGCDDVERAWITFSRPDDSAFTVVADWNQILEEDD